MNRMETAYIEPRDELHDGRRKNWFWDSNAIFDLGLSCHAIVVRLYLARCAGEGRKSWPSIANIASHCSISRATVKRAIAELEEKGLLRKETRQDEDGEYRSNIYTLLDPSDTIAGQGKEIPGRGSGLQQNLPCHEIAGVGSDRTYYPPGVVGSHRTGVGSHRTYPGSERATNNNQLTITSEEDVVVVKAGVSQNLGGAGGREKEVGCADSTKEHPGDRVLGGSLTGMAGTKTVLETGAGGEPDQPERQTEPEAADRIQELFIKTTGYPLPEAALNELVDYPTGYVEQKIKMLESGKEKTNTIGWLLEACREDYRYLPGPKPAGKPTWKGKEKPPGLSAHSKDYDKYRELYRLV